MHTIEVEIPMQLHEMRRLAQRAGLLILSHGKGWEVTNGAIKKHEVRYLVSTLTQVMWIVEMERKV